jgi:uncharacterized protein
MGHRDSPEESGVAGGVCGGDGGVAAAGRGTGRELSCSEILSAGGPEPSTGHRLKSAPPSVRLALFALRFYKAYLSMLFAGSCRFEPTCSQYSYEAVERFGLARGAWLTLKRLARCQPLSRKFGYDPVPEEWRVADHGEEFAAPAQDICRTAAASHEAHT